ncbi:MAG TPA: GNAT family N-acetyltransferase [Verrucomicrobiae bacterium]|nr:GNAT family N-acetyltransferase [Verrucomicrobiae bacterium]
MSTIRPARPADALALCGLFAEAYRPPAGGEAREHYPFPQFFDPGWVAEAVLDPGICWLVAELEGKVVGTVGAERNVGSRFDRVAEGFGLVVSQGARGHRIGTRLMAALYAAVEEQAHYFIAETRTADAGGWKCVRHNGFKPTGFEPFAHLTPAGREAMLLTARVSSAALGQRSARASITQMVRALAEPVLESFGVALPEVKRAVPFAVDPRGLTRMRQSPSGMATEPGPAGHLIERDDEAGLRYLQSWDQDQAHGAGVACLRRLEGGHGNPDRYDRRCFVMRAGGRVVAAARVVSDRRDRRARILDLKSHGQGLQGLLIAGIVKELTQEAAGDHLTTVIDVHTGNPELQATVEALNFFPTAYYPALIGMNLERYDAIQYTRLCHRGEFRHSLDVLHRICWPEAQDLILRINEVVRASKRNSA